MDVFWLKDHTVSSIISQIRNKQRNRKILIISGARKHESVRRWSTSKDLTIKGNTIWMNICNEWTDQDVYEFSKENNLEKHKSPISKQIGVSGDCFCGCFAQKGELTELKFASPTTYEKIGFIQQWLLENTNMYWSWEQSPPKGYILEKKGQLNMFTPDLLFCSTCMNNTSIEI